MRLEWLDDILAIFDAGSLNRAAQRRLLTQPAFSRRMNAIEDYLGVELLDRTRKPAQLRQGVRDREGRIRELAAGIRDLVHELRLQERQSQNRIVIASQHAITTSLAPGLVKRISLSMDISIRLRSANRQECLGFLFTKQADVTLLYRSVSEDPQGEENYIQEVEIGQEQLIPVIAASALGLFNENYARGELAVIAYPADVFLGQVMTRELFPRVPNATFVRRKAETALTLAALHLALAGVGVAWVPASLAMNELQSGRLVDLRPSLPHCELAVIAARLVGTKSNVEDLVWREVQDLQQNHNLG